MTNGSKEASDVFTVQGNAIKAHFAPWQAESHQAPVSQFNFLNSFHADQGTAPKSTASTAGSTVVVNSGGMTFDLNFDAAAMAAPQSFRDGIAKAASMLSSVITDHITVNLKIDYSGTGGGAAAGPDSGYMVDYATVHSKLAAVAGAGDNVFNALPNGSTIQGQSSVAVWNAQMKALGLMSANDTSTDDGAAYFATDINSNLLVGVALHELTHALGRIPYGSQPDIFDMYRFTSNGTRLFQGGASAPAAYFSVDGGATKLGDFGQKSDASDFLNSGVQGGTDPFDEYYTGSTTQALTNTDLTLLHALGFHIGTSSSPNPTPTPPPPPPAQADLSVTGLALTGNSLNFVLHNTGSGQAAASTTGLYLSTHGTPTTSDISIGSFSAGALQANGTQNESIALSLPTNLNPGTYYIAAIADSTSKVTESNEGNNTSNVIQVVVGNNNANSLSGSNTTLFGLGGNDTLSSNGGSNVFVGGTGSDTLIGGSGNDQFVYNLTNEGQDRIYNFHSGDHIDFAASGFGQGLAANHASAGTLDASHFIANATGFTNSTQEFWFNTQNHTLYFDADGSGHNSGAVAIATLQNNFFLHNTDILLV